MPCSVCVGVAWLCGARGAPELLYRCARAAFELFLQLACILQAPPTGIKTLQSVTIGKLSFLEYELI